MSRPGITYLEVAQAATQLLESGGRVTIEEVRKILGRGSHSTINRHLRDWRERQGQQLIAEQGLPDHLLIAVKGLHEALQAEAQQRIDQAEQAHTSAMTQLEANLQAVRSQERQCAQSLATLTAEHQELQASHRQQTEILLAAQQTAALKQVEYSTLQQRLEDRQLEIGRLMHEATQAQRNLEHYRETVRQHREEERAQHQTVVAQLSQQLNHLKFQQQTVLEQHQVLQQQLVASQQQLQTERQHLEALTQQQHALALRLQTALVTSEQLEQRVSDLSTERDALTQRLGEQQQLAQSAQVSLERCQAQLAYVTATLQQTEIAQRELADRNVFLLQEKAELLAQLKLIKT